MLNINDTLLLIIDVQDRLVGMLKNSEEIVKNNMILAKSARILAIPTIATEQYPHGLGSTILEIRENISAENIFEKTTFSAIENNQILEKIKSYHPKNIVLTGIETHICVYQTALELIKEGFNVYVVKNAVSSRKTKDYRTALELMRDYGAKLTCVETVLFELLKTSTHPNFKEIQSLIK